MLISLDSRARTSDAYRPETSFTPGPDPTPPTERPRLLVIPCPECGDPEPDGSPWPNPCEHCRGKGQIEGPDCRECDEPATVLVGDFALCRKCAQDPDFWPADLGDSLMRIDSSVRGIAASMLSQLFVRRSAR